MDTINLPKVKNLRRLVLTIKDTGQIIPEAIIRTGHDVCKIASRIHQHEGNNLQEFFYVIFLNRNSKTTGYSFVSMGGITGTVADPRIILAAALLQGAVSIILCHNHPSGNLKPSRSDEELTSKIKEAGKYHDIQVIDHIIIGEDEKAYYSFAEEGIL